MEISLSSDNEQFLKSQISAGIYKTISEAVNAAINIIIAETAVSQKRIDKFNKEIEIGIEAVKNGDLLDGQSVLKELREKYA